MQFPSEAARALAAHLNGVEIGDEGSRIPTNAKECGLVVVYGASDDLMEFRGALRDEIYVYEGGTAYLVDGDVLDEGDFDCGCKWAEKALVTAIRAARTIKAVFGEDDLSWQYRTDIPHATFDVMEEGETYCRGIVFDLEALEQNQPTGAEQ